MKAVRVFFPVMMMVLSVQVFGEAIELHPQSVTYDVIHDSGSFFAAVMSSPDDFPFLPRGIEKDGASVRLHFSSSEVLSLQVQLERVNDTTVRMAPIGATNFQADRTYSLIDLIEIADQFGTTYVVRIHRFQGAGGMQESIYTVLCRVL